MFSKSLRVIAAVLFSLLWVSKATAGLPAIEVGDEDNLTTPAAADTELGTGTTHTTKLIYDAGGGYTRPVEIKELARALRNDPDLIYEFVRNRVEIVPLFGLQKGALGAYLDRAGTAFDQAHLMVELLREAGTTANYKYGTITLTGTEFSDWLRITDAKAACQMLADGGIPATVNSATDCSTLTGTVSTVTMAHVWVEADIGGTNYLFDPSYKTHTFKAGIDLASAMSYTSTDFLTSAQTGMTSGTDTGVDYVKDVNAANIKTKLDTYASNLLTDLKNNHFVADIEDITGGQDIDQEVLPAGGLRQTSLPYTASASATWSGDIPDQYRTTLRVELSIAGESDTINVLFYVDEIYGRKLEIAPATEIQQGTLQLLQDDWKNRQRDDFILSLQVDEKTVREDDGTTPAQHISELLVEDRKNFDLKLTIDHPYAADSGNYMDAVIDQKVDLIVHLTIAHGWGQTSAAMLVKFDEELGVEPILPDDNEASAQNNLKANVGASYLAQFSTLAGFQANMSDATLQVHHNVGVVQTQAFVFEDRKYFLNDQAIHLNFSTGLSANTDDASATDRNALLQSFSAASAGIESAVMAQMLDVPDVISTAERFAWGEDNLTSAKYYLFEPGDEVGTTVDDLILVEGYGSCLGGCTDEFYLDGHSTNVHGDIKDYLAAGYKVLAVNDAFLGPGWELGWVELGNQNPDTREATLQRGSAFIAFKGDLSSLGNLTTSWKGSYYGGGAAISPNFEVLFRPALSAELKAARLSQATPTGANIMNGETGFSTGDVFSVGSAGFPYSLAVGFQYDQRTGQFQDTWHMAMEKSGSGLEVFGATHHLRAVASLVSFYVQQDVYKDDPAALDNMVLLPFIQNWWQGHATNNVVTFETGISGTQFVKLVDDTYDPPVGSNITLTQTGSRTAARMNEGIGDLEDPGSLTRHYDYSTVDFKITMEDSTEIEFINHTYLPNPSGGQDPVGLVNITQFRAEDMNFPSGFNVHIAYGTNNDTGLFVNNVSNDVGRTLDFVGAANKSSYTINDNLGAGRQVAISNGSNIKRITIPGGEKIELTANGGLSTDPDVRPMVKFPVFEIFTPGRPDTSIPAIQYAYNTENKVISLKDGEAIAQEAAQEPNPRGIYEYFSAPGHRAELRNPLGGESTFYVDGEGNLGETIDPLGRVVSFSYDALGRLLEQVALEGNKTQFVYNDDHKVTTVTQIAKPGSGLANRSQTATWSTTNGKPLTTTDFLGRTTTFTYGTTAGSKTRVTTIDLPVVDTVTPTWTFAYDAEGRVSSITRPDGVVNTTTFDSSGNLTALTKDEGTGKLNLTTQFAYDTVGNMTKVADPRGDLASAFTSTLIVDVNRRIVESISPAGESSLSIFDTVGQLVSIEQPLGATEEVTFLEYTNVGLRFKTTSPDGAMTVVEYDDLDRPEVVIDPTGRKSKTVYNAAGQVLEQIWGFGSVDEITYSTLAYNLNGTVKSVEDANGNLSEFFYDGFDRIIKTQYPDPLTSGSSNALDTEEVTYDAGNNVLTTKTRRGDTFLFTYDTHNRLKTKTPAAGKATGYSYDIVGRLTEVKFTDDSYIISHVYDNADRITSTTNTIGLTVRTVSYEYDAGSNLTKLTYPNGRYFTYAYDSSSRLTLLEYETGLDIASYTYDVASRLSSLQYGTGPASEFTYELDGALDTLEHDMAGTADDTKTWFDYDEANRTTRRVTSNTSYIHQVSDSTTTYNKNGLNQYTDLTKDAILNGLDYDGNGNLTGDGVWTYTYDDENRLLTATDGVTTATYEYDPLGRRFAKVVNGTRTEYLSSGAHEIMEYDNVGSVAAGYVFGPGIDNPVMMVDGPNWALDSKRTFYRQDALGTIIATTDSSGTLKEKYTYSSYGKPDTPAPNQPIMYTGRRWDSETGLYFYRNRYYSPVIGRFLQTDPIGYADNLNLYAYVGNDPVNFSDPSGRQRGRPRIVPPNLNVPTPLGTAPKLRNPGEGDSSDFSDISRFLATPIEETLMNIFGLGNFGGNFTGPSIGTVFNQIEFAFATHTTFVRNRGVLGAPRFLFEGSGGQQGALNFIKALGVKSLKVTHARGRGGSLITISVGHFSLGGNSGTSGTVTSVTHNDDGSTTVTVVVSVIVPGSRIPRPLPPVTVTIPPVPEEDDDEDDDDQEQD